MAHPHMERPRQDLRRRSKSRRSIGHPPTHVNLTTSDIEAHTGVARRAEERVSVAGRAARLYSSISGFLLSSILIAIAGHYLIGLYIDLRHYGESDPRAALPVYDAFPDREQLWKDFGQLTTRFEPYVHWQWSPITTTHITIEPNGLRRTIKQPEPHAKKVFVMGGSTVWGTGAPDHLTIPSLLQAALGSDYDVHNFGGTGYVSTQELNQLLKALSDGTIPDYVIFYDGNNDGYAGAYSPAVPRDPQNLRKRAEVQAEVGRSIALRLISDLYEHSNYSKLFWRMRRQRWDNGIEGKEAELAKQVLDYYEANIRQVRALAKEYGFKAYFFWQPNLMNPLRQPVAYEAGTMENESPVFIESQRHVYYEAKKRLANRQQEGIFFLADIFNDIPSPVYLDWSHTSPDGNRIIATAIFGMMKPAIAEPAF